MFQVAEWSAEPTCVQLERLRAEAHMSVEELAEAVGRDPTTVSRNLSGTVVPHHRTIGAYERIFSKRLGRKVVIKKMPGKRR